MAYSLRRSSRSPSRRTLHVGLTASVLGGLLIAVPQSSAGAAPEAGGTRHVIVELDGAPAVAPAATASASASATTGTEAATARLAERRRAVGDRQRAFLSAADRAGIAPAATSVRKLGLLVDAVAMTVPAADVDKLKAMPGVKAVVPDAVMHVTDDDANALTGVPQVWKQHDPAGAGVTGKGTTIAVIDSGVDYTHPDLGGGFGEGHKVVGGYDFVNGDADPMDDNAHGTHVAGIIAGKAAEKGGVTGAAPDAQLLAYKVMDADGSGLTSTIIAGIEAAVDPANPHRADVINMSIGGPGDGSDPLSLAASAAVDAGVVVVTAAGNEGPGPYTVGAPAAARGVIAVGASTSGIRIPELRPAGRSELLQTYRGLVSANPPAAPVSGTVVDIGAGTPEDWERAGDVSGRIVLYAYPPAAGDADPLYPEDLAVYREAQKRGALALIGGASGGGGGGPVVFGDRARAPDLTTRAIGKGEVRVGASSGMTIAETGDDYPWMDRLVVLGVDRFQGQDLAAMAGTDRKLTLSGRDSSDQIASFSSRGPDADFDLKPDIVAPGVDIRSTVPTAMVPSGVWKMSGTSMASPLVAGSAALLRQLHPDRSAAAISADLIGSAKQLPGVDRIAQGAGRLDVPAAAAQTLTASPTSVSLGLADMGSSRIGASRTVTLHNDGPRTVTGRVTVDGAGARVSPGRVRIPAGGTATVRLTVSDRRPEATTHFSGAITVTPDSGHPLAVPYLLEAIPLYVDATPDPSDGASTAYVYSGAPLATPPVLTVDPPAGRTYTVTTRPTADPHYFTAALTGTAAGVYRLTARGTATTGARQYGTGGYEVTPVDSRGADWKPVGPNSASGPVTLAPSAPGEAVMTQGGDTGAWLTTNSGRDWSQITRTPFAGAATDTPSVVIDAHNPKRWWSALTAASWSVNAGGIMRTDDNGRTWQRLNAPDAGYHDLVADKDTKVLVAQTDDGLYVSRDAGATWTAEDLGIQGDILSVAFGGDDLYVWAGQSVWAVRGMSGAHPQPARPVFTLPGDRSQVIAGFSAEDQLVAVQLLGKGSGVIVSKDGGRTWAAPYGSGGGLVKVAQGDIYYDGLSSGARISRDGGATWTPVTQPNSASVVFDYDRWADGSYTVSAGASGVYRSTADGGYRRIGVQGESVPSLAVSGDRLMAGTSVGMYSTRLPATSPEWGTAENEGTAGTRISFLRTYAKDPRIVWRVFENLFGLDLQKSVDGGRTWESRGTLDGTATSLLIDKDDPDKVAVGYQRLDAVGLYTTTDGGGHWKGLRKDDVFRASAADPNRPGRIWLGGYNGVYFSDDFGATLTKAAGGEVSALSFTGSTLIVGGTSLRYSSDGGRTFHDADSGDLRIQVSDLLKVGRDWYAGTTSRWMPGEVPYGARGVLRSTDGGRTWHSVSGGLRNTDVLSLAAPADGGALYVGTTQGGVHRLSLRR
ncbi:S8 family serine peptidase [Actinacidiphila alni]|uniref:S8 family serine peptidase n=1 Tax=Actinacidiphila alni TaxID=380248 RepID=UPI0034008D87